MCNTDCLFWTAKNISNEEIKGKVILEIGSKNENGSVRPLVNLLKPKKYVGIDISSGEGVDVVCACENLTKKFGENAFDFVFCTCVLEHICDWKLAVSNMKRVCKPNGYILLIVPSQWPYHEYPGDFWRYQKKDIKRIFSDCRLIALEEDLSFHKDLRV